jgi:hypothetical protein
MRLGRKMDRTTRGRLPRNQVKMDAPPPAVKFETIPHRHQCYSPFFSRLIALVSSTDWSKVPPHQELIREIANSGSYLLDADLISTTDSFDRDFVRVSPSIMPNPSPIDPRAYNGLRRLFNQYSENMSALEPNISIQ